MKELLIFNSKFLIFFTNHFGEDMAKILSIFILSTFVVGFAQDPQSIFLHEDRSILPVNRTNLYSPFHHTSGIDQNSTMTHRKLLPENRYSAEGELYVLDYTVDFAGWEYRDTYTFDKTPKVVSILTDGKGPPEHEWKNYSRKTYTYAGSADPVSILRESWDIEAEEWKNASLEQISKSEYSYSTWKISSEKWQLSSRKAYEFNHWGEIETQLYQSFDSNSGALNSEDYIVNSYDQFGNRVTSLYQYRNSSAANPENSRLYTYSYNQDLEMTTRKYQYWDGTEWQNWRYSTFAYDADGNLISELDQIWNEQWENLYLYTHIYDHCGNPLSDLIQNWKGEWQISGKRTYSYNRNGDLLIEEYKHWDEPSGQWKIVDRQSYTYDAHGFCIIYEDKLKIDDRWERSSGYCHFKDSFYTYDFFVATLYIHYRPFKAILPAKNYVLNNNYPNPFNNSTILNYILYADARVNLTIYNTIGQKITCLVDEEQLVGNYRVDFAASTLASGTYFYQISVNEHIETRKMVLIK